MPVIIPRNQRSNQSEIEDRGPDAESGLLEEACGAFCTESTGGGRRYSDRVMPATRPTPRNASNTRKFSELDTNLPPFCTVQHTCQLFPQTGFQRTISP